MNKRKKGFLSVASILTIVGSGFAILMSLIMFLAGSMSNEQMIKDSFRDSGEYIYHEEADGSYYFIEIDEDTLEEIRIGEEEIEIIATITAAVLYVGGVLTLAFAIVRLILAIKTLINNNRQKYSLGLTITSLVFSILTAGTIEAAFWIVSLCIKNKVEAENEEKFEQITIE